MKSAGHKSVIHKIMRLTIPRLCFSRSGFTEKAQKVAERLGVVLVEDKIML